MQDHRGRLGFGQGCALAEPLAQGFGCHAEWMRMCLRRGRMIGRGRGRQRGEVFSPKEHLARVGLTFRRAPMRV